MVQDGYSRGPLCVHLNELVEVEESGYRRRKGEHWPEILQRREGLGSRAHVNRLALDRREDPFTAQW